MNRLSPSTGVLPMNRIASASPCAPVLESYKVDIGGLIDYFPRACGAVAQVSAKGAEKYTWKGWESVPDGMGRYQDALGRHWIAQGRGEEIDYETGLLHKAQVAWNALAVLELHLRKQDEYSATGASQSRVPMDRA